MVREKRKGEGGWCWITTVETIKRKSNKRPTRERGAENSLTIKVNVRELDDADGQVSWTG